ncbi:MAG: hypothetical protein LUO82_04330, partial [Methanomicrobiales archaeon]|nr:hypothetical protein [Methanomicrobiales archaeon]
DGAGGVIPHPQVVEVSRNPLGKITVSHAQFYVISDLLRFAANAYSATHQDSDNHVPEGGVKTHLLNTLGCIREPVRGFVESRSLIISMESSCSL